MAVESRHLNFFQTGVEPNMNPYGLPPLSGTTTDSFVPVYGNVSDSFADSGLTYANQINPRKRLRESINPMMSFSNGQIQSGGYRCGAVTFLGEDLSLQIQQQQLEMDRLIAQHTEKVRMEMEERRKRYSRRVIAAVEENITKRLKAKDDEIEKITKLNWALEEKIQSIAMEGQIWRDLAHTNEAAVHSLRANLEQALAAQQPFNRDDVAAHDEEDAQSCCGDNYEEKGEEAGTRGGGEGKCGHCKEGESRVLLLPCRHLCLCTVCGSSVHTCPVCNTPKDASVQVIMSG